MLAIEQEGHKNHGGDQAQRRTDSMQLAPFLQQGPRSAEVRSRPSANSCALVGLIMVKVNGTTQPMSNPPVSHIMPPPSNQTAIPVRLLKIANGACITVARL